MFQQTSFRDLVRNLRDGDPQAALELVREYEWAIRLQVRVRLTQLNLRRLLDSMDIVQLVWASFFPGAAAGEFELEDPKKLLNLLITLAHNKLLDEAKNLRRKRRGGGLVVGNLLDENDAVDRQPGPEQLADRRDFMSEFRKRLSAHEQGLWDHRLLNRSWVEIAALMGGEPDVLRIQLNRAVARVTKQLKPEEAS